MQQRPRNRDPLFLAARQPDAAFADYRVVALRQLFDEFMGVRRPRRLLDLSVAGLRVADFDVGYHGVVEEIDILQDEADGAMIVVQQEVAENQTTEQYGRLL